MKAEDLRAKVGVHCADLNIETPLYGTEQKKMIDGWLQGHSDILKEILKLRIGIQKTNIATPVSIQIDGQTVTKTIAEWIHRRRDLAKLDMDMWAKLGDKQLKEHNLQTVPNGPVTEVRIRRYFDPVQKDTKIALYRSEPGVIDGTLEVVNAVTDVIE